MSSTLLKAEREIIPSIEDYPTPINNRYRMYDASTVLTKLAPSGTLY